MNVMNTDNKKTRPGPRERRRRKPLRACHDMSSSHSLPREVMLTRSLWSAPEEGTANWTLEQQLLQQPEIMQPLQQDPPPDNIDRPRRSMSAPGVLSNPSQLQTFMAGLVSDVEEYIGRGGYRALSDDLGESLLDHGDDENVSVGLSRAYIEPGPRGWRWLSGDGGRQDEGSDEQWPPPTKEHEGLRTTDDLDAALLSEQRSLRHLEDTLLLNGEPRQDLRVLRSRSFSSSQYGGNSVSRTVITFLKAMVGSYVLYLPRMFAEGGMLFSAAAVIVLGIASTYNMLLLLRCRELLARRGVLTCTFGDVGYAALGRMGWICVDVSLFLSQLGYCVVYFIFVADNMGPLLRRTFSPNPPWLLGTVVLILAQVPLSWVRRLKYLGAGLLVANVCIFSGLVVILIEVAKKLAEDGIAREGSGGSIILINPSDCLILLGAAVGLFEGIGLVLPIEDAMDLKVRDRLPAALSWAMAGLTVFLISVGALGYLAYGRDVQHFITMDLPEESAVGVTIRVAYSMGLILTFPLQLFPAVRVLDKLVWPAAGNGARKLIPDYRRKWLKNLSRSILVAITALIAMGAGNRFDSFIGIVGGVCAVPLALVYPPLFHLTLFGKTDSSKQERNLHRGLLIAGVFAGLSSTIVAIKALL